MSSLHALADSSSADVAPTLSPSSVAVAASDSRSAHAPSSFQSRSIRSRWYSPHQLDQSGRPSSGSLHKVGPFDMSDKHLGAWGREAQLIFFILARSSFSLPPLMRMKALYLASLMSEILKSCNKQTQGGDSWNVDKPKKNGEDGSMGGPH